MTELGQILKLSVDRMSAQRRSDQVAVSLREGACLLCGFEVKRLIRDYKTELQLVDDLTLQIQQVKAHTEQAGAACDA